MERHAEGCDFCIVFLSVPVILRLTFQSVLDITLENVIIQFSREVIKRKERKRERCDGDGRRARNRLDREYVRFI